ncbi:MAG TPA: hypothetical protein VE261_06360, partial [Gaiellaceae bacterium]|nr:hypothetical protein [Gaiellaceae bacterium]
MSDRRKYLILMGAILAAVVGAVLLAVPGSPIYKKPVLGLDLRGGLEVVLKAVPPKGHQLTSADLDRSVSIMQDRINRLGVSEPEIRKQGSNQIVIQLAGVHDPGAAAKLIGKTATLDLFDFESDVVPPSVDTNGNPVAQPTLFGMLSQVQTQAKKGTPEGYYLFKVTKVTTTTKATSGKNKGKPVTKTTEKHKLLQGPAQTMQQLLKPYGGHQPADTKVLDVPANRTVVYCDVKVDSCLGAGGAGVSPTGTYWYLLKWYPNRSSNPIPEMTGGDLVLSGTRADFGQQNQPVVLLQFTGHGSNVFQRITRAEWERGKQRYTFAGSPAGQAQNYVQHFGIVLDGELKSTPIIDFTKSSLSNGISGGAEIDMGQGGSFTDAKNLALVLQTGALP